MQGLSFAWPVILFQTSWIYSLWNLTLEKEVQGKVSVSKSEFFAKEWAIFFWPTAQGLIQAQCVLGETRPKRLKSCNIKSLIEDLITFYPGTPFQAPWNIFQIKKYILTLLDPFHCTQWAPVWGYIEPLRGVDLFNKTTCL